MSVRLPAFGSCALVLAVLPFVWGCEQPSADSTPSPAQPDTTAVEAVPDSALVDSIRTGLDRLDRSSAALADTSRLHQWTERLLVVADSLATGQPDRAQTLFREALHASRALGDSMQVATSLGGLGHIHDEQSRYESAERHHRRALSMARNRGREAFVADHLRKLGDALRHQGRYDEALTCYREALPIVRRLGNQLAVAKTLNNAGLAHEYQGRYDEALDRYRGSLSIRREIGDREGVASILNNVGIVQAIQGHYGKALDRWKGSLEIKRDLGDREGVANTLNNLGNIYEDQGRYGKALVHFREALKILRDLDDREGVATALNNLGLVYKKRGRYEKALSQLQASLAIKRELDDRQGVARTLPNVGTIYQKQGRYEEALSHHRTSLSIKRELGDRRGIAVSLTDIGEVYEHRGRLSAALRQYRRALQINQDIGHRGGSVRTLSNIGALHLRQAHLPAATDTLERATHLAEKLRRSATSPDARRSLLATQIDTYRALTTAHIRADRPGPALRSLEQARARLLAERLAGTARGDTTFSVPPSGALQETLAPDEAALLYANVGTPWPLTAVVAMRDTIYTRELPDSTTRAAVGDTYSDPLQHLQQTDGPLHATLSGDQSVSENGPPSLAETIRLYRHYLSQEGVSSVQTDLARQLYRLLFEPVEGLLKSHESVTVVPSGVLGYLPVETLRTPTDRYLVETTSVRYAQSLTVLRQLQKRTYTPSRRSLLAVGGAAYRGPSPNAEGPLLASARGDSAAETDEQASALFRSAERRMARGQSPRSTYEQLGYARWAPLYGTKLEVQKLKRAVGTGTTLLTGSAASEARLRTMNSSGQLANYRRLHFATHGVAVPGAPQLSALVLSQAGASDSLAARDGYLTMREIADLNLRADVAVLSACRTGLGRVVAGEGVVSLSHAFLRSGANATLVSQWRVLDWSTQQFMTATYRRAQADTTSFAEAVTQVKRDFIAGTFGARNADPLRWAPFVYYGRE